MTDTEGRGETLVGSKEAKRDPVSSSFSERIWGAHTPQRVVAGRAKFKVSHGVANRVVPTLRAARRIDERIAEGNLFVLAHPRSGSTMLSHILQSHPEITGFGEHHVSYETKQDLDRLDARNAFFARQVSMSTRYSLDKIVWNQHEISGEVLAEEATRFLFLIRRPQETFESYRRVLPEFETDADRLRSYRNRLEGLRQTLERINAPERCFFTTYEELTGSTAPTLERASEWLQLKSPLSADYKLTSKTGSQSWGDPSQNIKAGTVLRLETSSVELEDGIREEAEGLYHQAIEELGRGSYQARKTSTPPIIDLTTEPDSVSSIQSSERTPDPTTS